MIAIHDKKGGFAVRWIEYCKNENIPFKLVDCYADNLSEQIQDCDALMWHHSQQNPVDLVIAKQILFAAEQSGVVVFPDFKTGWHFDDKVGQKYLLEMVGAPLVRSYAFFDKSSALKWSQRTTFPKVFKLRGGAGSSNVKLISSRTEAKRVIKQAFGSGFENFDRWGTFKEQWRKFEWSRAGMIDLAKGTVRFFFPPHYSKVMGREIGYVYFQDFIPNNKYDTRIIVIGGKAFGLRRYVRQNDFRASGSGSFAYERELFDERCVNIAFDVTKKLGSQCAAYDFVFDKNNNPLIVEVSYGFSPAGYEDCPGYWDSDLNWHEERFQSQDWMVDLVLKQVAEQKSLTN